MEINDIYMKRALELAARGLGHVSPNPMVGAVIVSPDGRVIGEGFHRRWGCTHAEVNAVASVAPEDIELIPESTIYVTLEPCSHYGKTPPCAAMLVERGFRRVVVGAVDPFEKVAGRGIEMLRSAGVEVHHGVMARESRSLNAAFFTAHTLGRPYVMLKWACSSDGYMDVRRSRRNSPAKFSTPVGQVLVHRLRSCFDAILAGPGTLNADNPRLDNRLWSGNSPMPVIIDERGTLSDELNVRQRPNIYYSQVMSVPELLSDLYSRGITSLMVEGGAATLRKFIESGMWDIARVETSPVILGAEGAVPSPHPPTPVIKSVRVENNLINYYSHNTLNDVKNL